MRQVLIQKPTGMFRRISYSMVICLVLNQFTLLSQKLINPNYRWTVDDGLPSNNITYFFEDSRHYFWVGTSEGLARFNGKGFDVFNSDPLNPNRLIGKIIVHIYEDQDQFLWVLTHDGGISKMDLKKEDPSFQVVVSDTFFPILKEKLITTPILWARGDKVMVKYQEFIKIYNIQTGISKIWEAGHKHPLLQPSNISECKPVMYSFNKVLLFNKEIGAAVFNIENGEVIYEIPDEIADEICNTPGLIRVNINNEQFVVAGENGAFWLFNWDCGSLVSRGILPLPGKKKLLKVGPSTKGTIIYSNDLSNFYTYHTLNGKLKEHREKLHIRDSIYSLYKGVPYDLNLNYWIISNYGISLFKENGDQFKNYTIPFLVSPYSDQSYISSLSRTPAGDLICIWNSELHRYDQGFNKYIPIELTKEQDSVQNKNVAVFDHKDQFYLKDRYLYKIDSGFRTLNKIQLNGNEEILKEFYQSRIHLTQFMNINDSLLCWMTTRKGKLFEWNTINNSIRKIGFSIAKSKKNERIVAILALDSKNILLAFKESGLSFINPMINGIQQFHTYEELHIPFAGTGKINDAISSSPNKIFLTQDVAGLISLDCLDSPAPEVRVYGKGHPNGNNYLKSILADSQENLWISTTTGITKWDSRTNHFQYFGYNDGIIFPDFLDFKYTDRLGYFYFAGLYNFLQFHPDSIQSRREFPHINLTKLTINSTDRPELKIHRKLVLGHTENDIGLYFDLIQISDLHAPIFRYKIIRNKDHQNQWNISKTAEIHLSNLEWGTYKIFYNARTESGEWQSKDQEIEITIQQAWYQSISFFIFCIALLIGLVYGIYAYRISEFKKILSIRNRISHDLHDDIGSTLASISVYSEVAKYQDQSKRTEILEKIGSSSREMIENLNDIVWSIKSGNDKIQDLETRMRQFAGNLLLPLGISFTLESNIIHSDKKIDFDQKRNLFLIYKEAIHNAIKYSNCTEVKVILRQIKGKLSMTIQDNGEGFDPKSQTAYNGNGIINMKKRAKSINSNIFIESSQETGTKIQITEI